MTDTGTLTLPPGSVVLDGFTPPEDIDAPHPTPYGVNPPLEWFTTPHHDVVPGASGLITADGRFCAFSHEWGRCHNGYTATGECVTMSPSPTGNRYFHQSSVVTAEGIQIQTGVIPLGEGHAPIDVDIYQAMAHYDKPERVTVWARAVETEHGAIMCGAIVPGTTHRQVATMRAAALSGDWRWVPELQSLDFLGPCFVARPGLPLGIEHAALEAALWDIQQAFESTVAADGSVRAVVSNPVGWAPRSTITASVPAAVVAAAHPGASMAPQPAPAAPSFVPGGYVAPNGQPHAHTAGAACSCQTPTAAPNPADAPATATAAGVAPRRVRAQKPVTAAAGTPFSYRELDDVVREQVRAMFAQAEGSWAYVKDWDDQWVVFELEHDDPITGYQERDFIATMAFASDGTLTINRESATEVVTTYIPAPGSSMPAEAVPAPAEAPVTAHASDTAAISELSGSVAELATVVESLTSDVARMSAAQLEPADTADVLPPAT